MATVGSVQRQIAKVEGFPVVILHPDGRNVRDDRTRMPGYPFERAMRSSSNVTAWKRRRFYPTYPGFEVEVVGADRRAKHGATLLGTVRGELLDA